MVQRVDLHRRLVLRRLLGGLVGLPLVGALVATLRRVKAQDTPTRILIPADVPSGLSLVDWAVVHRDPNGGLRVFSARCTHLGCRIDRIVGEEAVCPCHGSRFQADGTVAAGQARRPLTPLDVEPDPSSGGWIARAS